MANSSCHFKMSASLLRGCFEFCNAIVFYPFNTTTTCVVNFVLNTYIVDIASSREASYSIKQFKCDWLIFIIKLGWNLHVKLDMFLGYFYVVGKLALKSFWTCCCSSVFVIFVHCGNL